MASGNPSIYGYVYNTLIEIDVFGLNAAKNLPRLIGKSVANLGKILKKAGFQRVGSNPINQTWKHPDGSEVLAHPYGNKREVEFKSANNAHVHKNDPSGAKLNDRGVKSMDPNETHIGTKNPKDLLEVRNRQHGAGCK